MFRRSYAMPRESYIPTSAKQAGSVAEIRDAESDAVAFTYELAGALYAIGFHGKANKPDFHYRYRSPEERAAAIARHAAGRRASAEFKAKLRAERKATPCRLEVGSILVASWGYDQTNIDWYQVTARVGTRTVELREIGAEREETGFMSGTCSPKKGVFIGEPFRRLVNGDAVKIDSVRRASLWNGGIRHWSSYA